MSDPFERLKLLRRCLSGEYDSLRLARRHRKREEILSRMAWIAVFQREIAEEITTLAARGIVESPPNADMTPTEGDEP